MKNQVLKRAISFIDSWLRYRYERLEMPGFVVAIAHNGQVQFSKAYGYANLEQREAMTTDHVFRIASHSKTFTATAIMQLAQENLLSIDDPVAKYVPWLGEHPDSRMKTITVRQVMSHGAGIIRDGIDGNFWSLKHPFPDSARFKSEFAQADLILENNTQMKYSNIGYSLLGCLVEEVAGVPFNLYVEKKILEPLSLSDTGPEFRKDVLPKMVTGYTRRDLEKQRLPITQEIDTGAMSAATGFYSTAADMCTYFDAQFVKSGKLLQDDSKKEMQRTQWRLKNSPENQEYGLGFGIDYAGGRRLFGHGGGFPGQITRTFCDPKTKIVVVVLTNCIDGEAYAIGKGIWGVINHFETSAEAADPASIGQLRKFEGRFMNLWRDVNIVESGKHLIALDPNTWYPFGKDQPIEKLECIDDCVLKIESTEGYRSEGELVKYNFDDDDTVKSIRYAASDMWTEAQYNKLLATTKSQRRLVALPV